jgi:hypothetical protein
VNVKKIKPTAKFYGKGQRRVITLENEQASLPLRLTGDGVPIQFPYRHLINLRLLAMAYQISQLRTSGTRSNRTVGVS